MKILITGVSNKVELVKRFKEVASSYPNTEIVVADSNKYSPALYFGDSYEVSPKYDHPDFIPFTTLLCKENAIDLLIPSEEIESLNFAKNVDSFRTMNCDVLTPSLDTLEMCFDRRKLNDFLLENHFSIPETYRRNDQIRFPIIARPADRLDKLENVIIQTEKHLTILIDKEDDRYILQSLLDWSEFNVEVFSDFKGNVISAIPIELVKTKNKEVVVARVIYSELITSCIGRLSKAIGLIGHNYINCFYNGNDVLISDIRFGFGATSNFAFAAGTDSPKRILDIAHGKTIEPSLKSYKTGLVSLKYNVEITLIDSENQLVSQISSLPQIYCFAIDGTLCSESEPYEQAQPVQRVIDRINMLYEYGNTIILYSSRGDTSGYDWRELTEKQLEKWGVKYNELRTNKPYADFYIDSKSLNIFDLT